jgi:putative ABC transport system permease protein
VIFTTITTEYDYAHTMGIKILMGRDFSHDHPSDSSAILINKAALDLMGLEDPLARNWSSGEENGPLSVYLTMC